MPTTFKTRALAQFGGTLPETPRRNGDLFTFQAWVNYFKVATDITWRYMYPSVPFCYRHPSVEPLNNPPTCNGSSGVAALPTLTGYTDNSKVEVFRACCDSAVQDNQTSGYWMYAAPGSGIYYDVGKTIVFADHADAYASLTNTTSPENGNVDARTNYGIAVAALALGYDSVQYTHRLECVYLYEIQDLRDVRPQHMPNACSDKVGPFLSSGFEGSLPCNCSPTLNALNCDG